MMNANPYRHCKNNHKHSQNNHRGLPQFVFKLKITKLTYKFKYLNVYEFRPKINLSPNPKNPR